MLEKALSSLPDLGFHMTMSIFNSTLNKMLPSGSLSPHPKQKENTSSLASHLPLVYF
jgi:hypothetical protein